MLEKQWSSIKGKLLAHGQKNRISVSGWEHAAASSKQPRKEAWPLQVMLSEKKASHKRTNTKQTNKEKIDR